MAGATTSKVSFIDRFKMAISLHKKNSVDSLLGILKQPTNSLLTILVLAIALALPGIFYIMTNSYFLSPFHSDLLQFTASCVLWIHKIVIPMFAMTLSFIFWIENLSLLTFP